MSEFRVPDGWKKDVIGNLLKISTGDKDTQEKIKDSKYPFFVRSNTIEQLDSYSFEGEAVLTAGDGVGVGKVFHHYNGKFAFHQRVYAIHSFNQIIDGKYFYNFFSANFLQEIEKYSAKTSVDSVRRPMITNMEILLPPLNEQQKIAEILSELDNTITLTKELIEKNKRLKTALMQELLSYGIDEKGQIRGPQTHKFKPSPLGDIPVEWECVELGKVCDDFIVPMRDKPKVFKGSTPWCKIEDFNGKYLSTTQSNQYVDEVTIKKMNLKVNPIDTVLCSCSAVIGVTTIVKKPLITNQTFIGLVPNKIQLDSGYLYYLLPTYKKRFENLSSGTTIVYISRKQFEEFTIILPSKIEQQKIANILSSQDEKIEKLQNKLTKLNHLKTSLMQDLLSGKVRVNKLLESKQ